MRLPIPDQTVRRHRRRIDKGTVAWWVVLALFVASLVLMYSVLV